MVRALGCQLNIGRPDEPRVRGLGRPGRTSQAPFGFRFPSRRAGQMPGRGGEREDVPEPEVPEDSSFRVDG
jgi:hypothetical protein